MTANRTRQGAGRARSAVGITKLAQEPADGLLVERDVPRQADVAQARGHDVRAGEQIDTVVLICIALGSAPEVVYVAACRLMGSLTTSPSCSGATEPYSGFPDGW
jgi:hypothetical protein